MKSELYDLFDESISPPLLLHPLEWIDRFFQSVLNCEVSSIPEIKSVRGKSCIMDNPSENMAHRYIGGTLPKCVALVDDALSREPGPRMKPLVATVKGVGGGKTRLLEEIRGVFNGRNDSIALSVTFNNNMDYMATLEHFTRDSTLNFIFSIMIRYVALVYEMEFDQVRKRMLEEVDYLDVALLERVDSSWFVRYFLRRIIMDIRNQFPPEMSVNIVFLIDEVMAAYSLALKLQPDVIVLANFKAALSTLNKAMLNERFVSGINGSGTINVALVMSSLDVSATGVTDSSRGIYVLPYAEKLNSTEIVEEWWTRHIPYVNITGRSDYFRLKLISETASSLPRILSTIASFVKSRMQSVDSLSAVDTPFVDSVFFQDLFIYVFTLLKARYFVEAENCDFVAIFGLVYQKPVLVNDKVRWMLQKSILTNIAPISPDPVVYIKLPSASLVTLAFLSGFELDLNRMNYPEGFDLLNPFHCFFMVLQRTLQAIDSKHNEGDSLESLFEWWLKCRIASARSAGKDSISLSDLLPISKSIRRFLPTTVHLPEDDSYFLKKSSKRVLPNISGILNMNRTQIFKLARKVNSVLQLEADENCLVLESPRGQSFDLMVVCRNAESGNSSIPISVHFFEFKSGEVIPQSTSSPKTRKSTKISCVQFKRILVLIGALKELTSSSPSSVGANALGKEVNDFKLSNICEALINGNYCFNFFSTYAEVQAKAAEYSTHPNLVISDAASAEKYFGMLWPVVQASRSSISRSSVKESTI